MQEKKNFIWMTFGLLSLSCLASQGAIRGAKADNELVLFENGNFIKEVASHTAGSAITDGKWHNDQSWSPSRALLKETIDLSSYDSIKVTYTNEGSATWVTFSMGNGLDYGEFHYPDVGKTYVSDGEEHEMVYSLEEFTSKDLTCTWGTAHDDGARLDLTSIGGFAIKAGGVQVNISKIVAISKGGSDVKKEDMNIFNDGTWKETPTIDTAIASNCLLEDNMWKVRGGGEMLCRVKFAAIDLTGYKRLIVRYQNSNSESVRFGLGTIAADWGYTSAHHAYSVEMSSEVKELSIDLVDYDGAAFDKHLWATPSGNLNLAEIKGLDILTTDGQNIDILSIVATQTAKEEDFDPTAVDEYLFEGATTALDEKAVFHNKDAYKIKYGKANYAYVGTLDPTNNLNENIATSTLNGENKAIQFTNANLIRYDMAASFNLLDAMLNDGWIEFNLRFDRLPSDNQFAFRLYDGSGEWGERLLVEKKLDVEGTVGEWHTYRVNISDLDKICYKSSWGTLDSAKVRPIDLSIAQGVGFLFNEDMTLAIGDIHYGYTPVDRTITGIEATTSKTSYNAGSRVDLTSFKVDVLFSDENRAMNVSNYEVVDPGTLSEENRTVTVNFKYNGEKYTTTVDLTINKANALVIKKMPDKVSYNEGDAVDLTGLEVVATMSDGSELPLDNSSLTVSLDIVSETDTEIVISYAGASAIIPITVTSVGKTYSMFDASYIVEGDTLNAKEGYFLAGNDANSETPTTYLEKVDDTYAFVSNQTSDWRISRFLSSDGLLDVQAINEEVEMFLLVTYRTSNVGTGKMYLFNPVEESDWDQVYTNTTVNFNNDGSWHTVKISLDSFLKNTDGHLDSGDIPAGYSMLSPKKISGWGIATNGKIEISNISLKWNADLDAKWKDTAAPIITYEGETTFHQTAGEKPHEVKATAHDSYDGDITPTYTWSEGALDENGNLKEGTHTLTISAKDSAGNEAAVRTITYIVEAKVEPGPGPDDPSTSNSSSSSNENPTPSKKGCRGTIAGTSALAILALGGILISYKKKNEEE